MNKYTKPILALVIGTTAILGAAGLADARPSHRGGCNNGLTAEMQDVMDKAYTDIAPLQLELRAKQQELTAKIYGNADANTVQRLTGEVNELQKRLTDARTKMHQSFAKAGVPMQQGCPGGGYQGHMGGGGYHGNMGGGYQGHMGGGGYHGNMGGVPCPGMSGYPGDAQLGPNSTTNE